MERFVILKNWPKRLKIGIAIKEELCEFISANTAIFFILRTILMKNNGLRNPFPDEVRLLYLYVFACFNCGRSDRPLELHHIFKREFCCAFNACVLCHDCHEAVNHSEEEHARFFFLNQSFLLSNNYSPKDDDFEVIREYPFLIETDEFKKLYGKKEVIP